MLNRENPYPATDEPGVTAGYKDEQEIQRGRAPFDIDAPDDAPGDRSDWAAKGDAWAAREEAVYEEIGNRQIDRYEQGAVGPWDGPLTAAPTGASTGPYAFPLGPMQGGDGPRAGVIVLPGVDGKTEDTSDVGTNEWYPPDEDEDEAKRTNIDETDSIVGGGPWR
jgi:hypothetical protein